MYLDVAEQPILWASQHLHVYFSKSLLQSLFSRKECAKYLIENVHT